MKYFLKGDYYCDLDAKNQLRIAGPQNHLLLGLSFPDGVSLEIAHTELRDSQLAIELVAQADQLSLTLPLVTDIRTLRAHTEPVSPRPTYPELVEQRIEDLLPNVVLRTAKDGRQYIMCKNMYQDEKGIEQEFGAYIGVDSSSTLDLEDLYIHIRGQAPIHIWVETIGTLRTEPFGIPVFRPSADLPSEYFSPELKSLYDAAGREVEYLIRTRKTSGFEYGTIFPRDWIESADLGKHDLTPATMDYMYRESMRYVSERGEGWHEDVVGSYKAKLKDETLHVDRKMIDIEPKYIIGIRAMTTSALTDNEIQTKLRLVASYICQNAANYDLITFKKVSDLGEDYHFIGNWRDSYLAYPRQKSPLAPYDVNCVLYPKALEIIRDHADYFAVDRNDVEELVRKWSGQKDKFRLYHPNNIIGYSLALHGKKNIPLPIAHCDEAYDLFYGNPSIEETVSFAKKMVSPDFFYTPVGPLLVASDEDDFGIRQYHGKVIWPKQAAYCVAGLTKQYLRGVREGWPATILEEIKASACKTAEACFNGFLQLGNAPELYYYDDQQDQARLYTDQEDYEGQMSVIQLWSSIGCRRIMRDYAFINGYKLLEEDA